jgi:predicted DNA-binding transcriptional regulator YafY
VSKHEKLLTLLELLHNRRRVSLKEIQDVLGVSERTAFRYLQSLERANFAIDRGTEVSGYRILNRSSFASQFTDTEAALIYLGTLFVEHYMGDKALDNIKSARAKLEVRLPSRMQHVLAAGSQALYNDQIPESVRRSILLSLLLLSKKSGSRIRVGYRGDDGESKEATLVSPQIRYDRGWIAGDAFTGNADLQIPIDQIRNVDFLRNQ